jgi:acyl-[acyl carrier protein]--UDP-N-acetylglucosamine O-acyltransferase
MKKIKPFELTEEEKIVDGYKLYRIRCTKDIPGVAKAGELGGWVASPDNLLGNAWISGNACIYGIARISGDARISGNVRISGSACISGGARIYGNVQISGDAWIYGNARISGDACISGDAWISGNARISGSESYCCFQSFGRSGRTTTAFRDATCGVRVVTGCFSGTLEEFSKAVKETHGDSQLGREYKAIAEVIKVKFSQGPKR